jgi:hypothetical protein
MPRASIVYYTDHHLPAELAVLCRTQLVRAAQGREIVAVGLGSMTGFPVGSTACNLVHVAERGILTMHRRRASPARRTPSTKSPRTSARRWSRGTS